MDSGEDLGVERIVLGRPLAALLGADMDHRDLGQGRRVIGKGRLVDAAWGDVPVLMVGDDIVAVAVYGERGDADIVVVVRIVVGEALGQLERVVG